MTTRRSNFLLPSFLILVKQKQTNGGIDVPSPFCNENNNDKGVNVMFPLVYGVCNEDDNNKGNIMLPPIFDSFNKDNDGEGLVPTPPLCFQFLQWRWQWGGGQILCFPLIFGSLIKMKRRRKGVSIAIPLLWFLENKDMKVRITSSKSF